MTPHEAYKVYRDYYNKNQWKFEDVKYYLKECLIDYEEYNFEEFKEKVLLDETFNQRWGNGCREVLERNKK